MPPKKKGSKKKGGKKGGGDGDDEPLSEGDQVTFLTRQLEAYKHKLMMQTNKASGAEAVVRELRTRLLDLTSIYEKEKQHTFDIVSDMTREYKSMKEEVRGRTRVFVGERVVGGRVQFMGSLSFPCFFCVFNFCSPFFCFR